jgi:hypothetical protein
MPSNSLPKIHSNRSISKPVLPVRDEDRIIKPSPAFGQRSARKSKFYGRRLYRRDGIVLISAGYRIGVEGGRVDVLRQGKAGNLWSDGEGERDMVMLVRTREG